MIRKEGRTTELNFSTMNEDKGIMKSPKFKTRGHPNITYSKKYSVKYSP